MINNKNKIIYNKKVKIKKIIIKPQKKIITIKK